MSTPGGDLGAPQSTATGLPSDGRFAGFLSYSRADRELCDRVHRALEGLGRPLFRLRGRRVFRDTANIGASASLKGVLKTAMTESEYFILLASQHAANSAWVGSEVESWVGLHDGRARNVLIVLCSGDIRWNDASGDFDWDTTTALPRAMAHRFDTEPVFCDLRTVVLSGRRLSLSNTDFRDRVAEVVAPLDDTNKENIVGRHLAMRRQIATGAGLIAIVVAALAGGFVNQRREAQRQAEIVAARQILAQAAEVFTSAGDPKNWPSALQTALSDAQAAVRRLQQRLPELAPADEGYIREILETLPAATTRLPIQGIKGAIASDDGQRVLLGSDGDSMRIWDIAARGVVAAVVADVPVWSANMGTLAWQDTSGRLLADISGSRVELARGIRVPVRPVGMSPSGDVVAFADEARTLYIERIGSGQPSTLCNEVTPGTTSFSPDNTHMAAVCGNTLRVWNSRSGRQVASARLQPANFVDADFNDDGTRLAVATTRRVVLFGLEPLTLLASRDVVPPDEDEDYVDAIALDSSGTRVAINIDHEVIFCEDLMRGVTIWPRLAAWDFEGRGDYYPDALSPAAGYRDARDGLAVFDPCSGARIARIVRETPTDAQFYNEPARALALITKDSGEVFLLDLRPADQVGGDRLTGQVRAVRRAGDAPVIALATDQQVRVWDIERGTRLLALRGAFGHAQLDLSENGDLLSIVRADTLQVWQCLRSGSCDASTKTAAIREPLGMVVPHGTFGGWLSPDYLLIRSDSTVRLVRVTPSTLTDVTLPGNAVPVAIHPVGDGAVGLLLADPDGRRLQLADLRGGALGNVRQIAAGERGAYATGHGSVGFPDSGVVMILDGKQGRLIRMTGRDTARTLGLRKREYPRYEPSVDHRFLAVATNSTTYVPEPTGPDTVEIVDLATGRVASRIPLSTHVAAMRFGPGGHLAIAANAVVAGESGFRLRVFEPERWTVVTDIQVAGRPECLSFDADDRRLAVGQRDNTTAVIDQSGTRHLVIPQSGRVVFCELSRDGSNIATVGSTTDLATLRVTPASRAGLAKRLLELEPWVTGLSDRKPKTRQ